MVAGTPKIDSKKGRPKIGTVCGATTTREGCGHIHERRNSHMREGSRRRMMLVAGTRKIESKNRTMLGLARMGARSTLGNCKSGTFTVCQTHE